ncbi:MAG: ABC transporter substrate-binding protein, partial [Oscillospiraceae bacterium]
VNGKIYGICNGVNAPAMLYNKTLLDDAGITVKDNMNLDEFKALCAEVYEKTGYKTGLTYGSDTSADYINYLLRASGKSLYGDKKFGVDSAEEFDVLFDLFATGIAEGWHVDPSVYVERQSASVEQDCLVYGGSPDTMSWCAFYHSNQLAAMQNAAPEGVEIGISTWTSDDTVVSDYLKPSQFFCITTDSKNPEMGAKLINYLTNSVECNKILLGERGVPISSEVSTAIVPLLEKPVQKTVSFINDVVTTNCTAISPPAPASANQIKDMIHKLTEQVMYGQITVQAASQQLFEQGNAILAAE